MSEENTDWGKSVAGVVLRDGKVLLARHTYGAGKGRLIIPGGYLQNGESPEVALQREFLEETGVEVRTVGLLGVRFNMHDWYVVFLAEYVGGEARSDHDENSEVVWLDIEKALADADVPDLSKKLIKAAANGTTMPLTEFEHSEKYTPTSLYCTEFNGERSTK